MKPNLIKHEQDLDDLKPKKVVLTVKSKKLKTIYRKKNGTIHILPEDLHPESSDYYDYIAKERAHFFDDVQKIRGYESSDDDCECIAKSKQPVQFFYDEGVPGWDSDDSIPEDFEVSDDFDKEEPPPASKESRRTFPDDDFDFKAIRALFQYDPKSIPK